ncbi:MAG: 16S rRNA (uracil(1498)-N(3))-methyltransferase [Marinilabiliales bacterium]|nr:MAG: 16S rRNA (uracil(1498)-N(3))-methyltransferase [Marinilabiliales bacterium]
MQLFYAPDINDKNYILNETESKHCIRVLRKVEGDIIHLVDGKGGFYKTKINDANPKKCSLHIIDYQKEYKKRKYKLHIAIAPAKSIDRFEWFLEKATEIGIDEITPILCERSERKVIKEERLNKIIESSMKQSIKAYHPKLNSLQKFSDFIQQKFTANKYIAHCEESERDILSKKVQAESNSIVLIGPEGDFSPHEIEIAINSGYLPISLGDERLRTETAAVFACSIFNIFNQ